MVCTRPRADAELARMLVIRALPDITVDHDPGLLVLLRGLLLLLGQ